MKLREALDLIEFGMREEKVDRAAIRILVDDLRRTLLALKVDPDATVVEETPRKADDWGAPKGYERPEYERRRDPLEYAEELHRARKARRGLDT